MLSVADLCRIRRFQGERLARAWRRRPAWTVEDDAVRGALEAAGDDAGAMSRALLGYFWRGQCHYRDAHGTLADYPGWPSIYGARNDAIEGVTRLLPLWAAALCSPLCGEADTRGMAEALQRAFVHGCDPQHLGFWGEIGERSTLICEAADVALALWLARETVWPRLSDAQQRRLLGWLAQALGRQTADNNWHLFVVLIDAVLAALDPAHRFGSSARLERIWSFARADGCFSDGPAGQVDFYNAWGFHYLLFWLQRIAPSLLGERGIAALRDFCRWYRYLFTRQGLPLFGRSLCYRYAAPGPLLSCALLAPDVVSPGEALSAYLHCWRFFGSEGGLRAGRPSQGVFGEDLRWLDPYSGPASAFWGTRSLVLLLALSAELDWTAVELRPLPAQLQEQKLRIEAIQAVLWTRPLQQKVELQFDQGAAFANPAELVRRMGIRGHIREWLYGVAARPANNLRLAGLGQFESGSEIYR